MNESYLPLYIRLNANQEKLHTDSGNRKYVKAVKKEEKVDKKYAVAISYTISSEKIVRFQTNNKFLFFIMYWWIKKRYRHRFFLWKYNKKGWY